MISEASSNTARRAISDSTGKRHIVIVTAMAASTAMVLATLYWEGLVAMVTAWQRAEYSYGYLVPVISTYMFLHKLPDALRYPPRARWFAIPLAFGAIALGILGDFSNIADFSGYGFVIAIAALMIGFLGLRTVLRTWESVIHLFFMLPLPQIIYLKLTASLQLISSELGVAVIRAFNIPVLLEGNVIDLGVYQLLVAEACSGLRYMFPLMSFGFLFAVIFRGPAWQKFTLFASTIPITILMNSFRVGMIGVLVDRFGIEHAEGFIHYFEGWVIFIACMAILLLETYVLVRIVSRRRSLRDALTLSLPRLPTGAELGTRSVGSFSVTATIAIIALGVAAIQFEPTPNRYQVSSRQPLNAFPSALGGWIGRQQVIEPQVLDVLAADDYIAADYSKPGAETQINLFIAFYETQSEGNMTHSPQVCLPGGGWEINEIKNILAPIEGSASASFRINRAVIQKGLSKSLVYYWFEERGRRLTNEYVVKWNILWDGLTRGRTDGALLRLVTPITAEGGESAADARLAGFLREVLPLVPKYLPQ